MSSPSRSWRSSTCSSSSRWWLLYPAWRRDSGLALAALDAFLVVYGGFGARAWCYFGLVCGRRYLVDFFFVDVYLSAALLSGRQCKWLLHCGDTVLPRWLPHLVHPELMPRSTVMCVSHGVLHFCTADRTSGVFKCIVSDLGFALRTRSAFVSDLGLPCGRIGRTTGESRRVVG